MSDQKSVREIELELKNAILEQKVAGLEQKVADLELQLAEQLSLNEPARKKANLTEDIAYLYHFFDSASNNFIYHGYSKYAGGYFREYDHVKGSKKDNVTGKLIEINRLMREGGTGVQIFRSKVRLSRADAKNFEAAIVVVDDKSANIKAGSFCGEFLTYSEEQKREIGTKLLDEARACVPLNPTLYTYGNFSEYKPEKVERVVEKDVCNGVVNDEDGGVLFKGCGQMKELKNKSARFCNSCNAIACRWKNRAVCQGQKGEGCQNTASQNKLAVVAIFLLKPYKMCSACKSAYNKASKKDSK
ncbi:hypothetical protein M3Y97_00222600 [Aphelenchoides bicaudatus]|nr:hypothetical protein M3Y97_00222600 [Aphelenchoides bicaudatus]